MTLSLFKETVKDRNDIVEVIGSYLQLQRAGGRFKALCPFHNEKTPSFSVNPADQFYYCFGCHKSGDVLNFVMEIEGLDFMGALESLARRAGLPMPEPEALSTSQSPERAVSRDRKTRLFEIHEGLGSWYQQQLRSASGRQALAYIRGRGLDDDALVKFGIGYAPAGWNNVSDWGRQHGFSNDELLEAGLLTVKHDGDAPSRAYDRFRDRLMFPIWNEHGRIVGFSGRKMNEDDHGGKYVNSPETPIFHKSKVLYGLHLARRAAKDFGSLLICEGQMDAIACHRAGQTNAVAPQGTAFTEDQAFILRRYTDSIVLAFDADTAGIKAAIGSVDVFLPAGLTTRVVLLPEGQDPDGILAASGPAALRELLAQSQDYFDFLLDQKILEHGLTRPVGKVRVTQEYLTAVARVPSQVLRDDYCHRLANRLNVRPQAVYGDLRLIVMRQQRRGARAPVEPDPETMLASIETADDPAEVALLELALYHERYARDLLQALPVAYISNSRTGQALNEVLANTEQGEWAESRGLLQERLDQADSVTVRRILFEPEYAAAEQRVLDQAYSESLSGPNGLICRRLDRQFNGLTDRLHQAEDGDERAALRRQLLEINRRKRETLSSPRVPVSSDE